MRPASGSMNIGSIAGVSNPSLPVARTPIHAPAAALRAIVASMLATASSRCFRYSAVGLPLLSVW